MCLYFQLINICSSDGQRLYEAVSVGCLLAGGPLVGILGLSYTTYFLGPTALVGSAIFLIFYPFMVWTHPHPFVSGRHTKKCNCGSFGGIFR